MNHWLSWGVRRPAWRWLWPALWMALIFWFSHQPKANLPDLGWLDLLVKKLAHLVAYAILAWLWYNASGNLTWALTATVVYAALDEIHQTYIPNRHGTPLDIFIDGLGAVLGLRRRRRPQAELP